MTDSSLSDKWSERFGLARSPMFASESTTKGEHVVLLDGGYGSFGLSVVEEREDPLSAAAWAWSSDLPHHVTVSKQDVQVVRWDIPSGAERYTLGSINSDLDGFYRYLCNDRLRSNRSVVQHLVNLFGRIRTLTALAGLPDVRSIEAFITVLADLIAGEAAQLEEFGLPDDAPNLRDALSAFSLSELLRDIRSAPTALSGLTLHPDLAIRHAGGLLFQEAHFDLVRAPAPDMFGYVESASATPNSRGGTHFTPPALARSIVDYTLAQVPDLATRRTLVISDPACGSAAFLHEALRGLRRSGFNGALTIVGRDVSSSAIAMAHFTLKLALRDWAPQGGAKLDLLVADALEERAFPRADITVMNPPFISVIAQTAKQKAQLRAVVGEKVGGRGDYSMAFVTRAIEALSEGGALGTLFPANLLTHEAASPWREQMISQGNVRLLASIGDFGLFSQALVHVACLVLSKKDADQSEFTALVTGNEVGATGDALRQLRKTRGVPPTMPIGDQNWQLFAAPRDVLVQKLPWRILKPEQRELLDAIEAAQVPTVLDLFDVSQGVQTGLLKAFLFDQMQFDRLGLPPSEQQYFRDALMTDSIEDGRIVKQYRLFYPHRGDGSVFVDEAELAEAVPNFYRTVLLPNKAALQARVSVAQAKRKDWWGLMRPRAGTFGFSTQPRIISKFFGTEGSFVLDEDATYLPSTGHVWQPKLEGSRALSIGDDFDAAEGIDQIALLKVMRAYVTLLNSGVFIKLVSYRSVMVSGGQYDLSSRFLNKVHLPNLWEKAADPRYGHLVQLLAGLHSAGGSKDPRSQQQIEIAVALLYGVPSLAEV